MVIQHNISALNSWGNIKLNNSSTSKNLEKLSSGSRINRAADDAAGLAISEKMRGQIRGLAMAETNVDHGVNFTQTAEGGMEEIINMIQRQRELMVTASNGTYADADRDMIQKEIEQLNTEITATARKTQFNGIGLLAGATGAIDFGVDYGPALNARVLAPKDVLNYFENEGSPYQFSYNTRTEVLSEDGMPIGLTYDPVTHEKGLMEVDGVDWTDGDVLKFGLGFDVNVNAIAGQWWNSSTNTYYPIPSTMYPGSNYSDPNFKPAAPITNPYSSYSSLGTGSNFRWVTSVPSAIVYPDITVRSPGYPDANGSFEVTWEGSKGVPASIKCTACGGSPCTCGTVPEGFKDRIQITPNPVNNSPIPSSAQLKITIDGDFLNTGSTGSLSENGGLTNLTLSTYDGLWDVEVVNESPQTFNSGNISYNAVADYTGVLPGHPLWTFGNAPSTPTSSTYYNVVFDPGYDPTTNPGAYHHVPRPQNLGGVSLAFANSPISAQYVTSHHHSYVTGGASHLGLAVDRPEKTVPIQCGANVGEQIDLTVYDARAFALGLTDFWGKTLISAETVDDANASIERLDKALITVLGYKTTAGVENNRLEHANRNIGVTKENLQTAESSIRDLDMAKEMMDFTKNNILAQASQSLLAQANQLPQGVLSLLR